MSKGSDDMADLTKNEAWKKKNTTRYTLRLQNSTDADILAYIQEQTAKGKSVQGIIKDAIRLAIKNETAE